MNKDIIDLKWLVEHYATHEELIERINAIPTPPSPTKSELPSRIDNAIVFDVIKRLPISARGLADAYRLGCESLPQSEGQRYGEGDMNADIRNKLSPFKNLIALLEETKPIYSTDERIHDIIEKEIDQCKKNIEYLQSLPQEPKGSEGIFECDNCGGKRSKDGCIICGNT